MGSGYVLVGDFQVSTVCQNRHGLSSWETNRSTALTLNFLHFLSISSFCQLRIILVRTQHQLFGEKIFYLPLLWTASYHQVVCLMDWTVDVVRAVPCFPNLLAPSMAGLSNFWTVEGHRPRSCIPCGWAGIPSAPPTVWAAQCPPHCAHSVSNPASPSPLATCATWAVQCSHPCHAQSGQPTPYHKCQVHGGQRALPPPRKRCKVTTCP